MQYFILQLLPVQCQVLNYLRSYCRMRQLPCLPITLQCVRLHPGLAWSHAHPHLNTCYAHKLEHRTSVCLPSLVSEVANVGIDVSSRFLIFAVMIHILQTTYIQLTAANDWASCPLHFTRRWAAMPATFPGERWISSATSHEERERERERKRTVLPIVVTMYAASGLPE